MDDASPELNQLHSELGAIEEESWAEWNRVMAWQLQVGPIRMQRAVGSQTIFRAYMAVNSLLLALGFGLIFVGCSTSTAVVSGRGQPACVQISSHLPCPWMTVNNRRFPAVLACARVVISGAGHYWLRFLAGVVWWLLEDGGVAGGWRGPRRSPGTSPRACRDPDPGQACIAGRSVHRPHQCW